MSEEERAGEVARPTRLTPEQKRSVVEELAKQCAEWGEDDAADWVEPLLKVISMSDDGYRLAQALERYGVDPDAALVEILDGASWDMRTALDKAEKEWAAQTNPQPPFAIDARVSWRSFRGSETGTIVGIYEHGAAKCLIAVDGDTSGARRIVNFEDTRLVAAALSEERP